MVDVEKRILEELSKTDQLSSEALAATIGVDHDKVIIGKLKSLASDAYVDLSDVQKREGLVIAGKESEDFVQNGSAEFRVHQAIGTEGLPLKELDGKLGKDIAKVGSSKGMAKKWMALDKATGMLSRTADNVTDDVGDFLRTLAQTGSAPAGTEKLVDEMKKRKLIKASCVPPRFHSPRACRSLS